MYLPSLKGSVEYSKQYSYSKYDDEVYESSNVDDQVIQIVRILIKPICSWNDK